MTRTRERRHTAKHSHYVFHSHAYDSDWKSELSNPRAESKDIANAEKYKDSIEVKLLDLCSMRPLSSLLGDPIVLFHASFCRCRRSPGLQHSLYLGVGTGPFDLCSWSWYEPSLLALDSWPELFRSLNWVNLLTMPTDGTPSNWSLC